MTEQEYISKFRYDKVDVELCNRWFIDKYDRLYIEVKGKMFLFIPFKRFVNSDCLDEIIECHG